MKRLIPGFFVLIFVAACARNDVPQGIIESDKMISVLTDVHLVDSYVSSAAYDSTTRPIKMYYKVVYQKYKIDSVTFQKSLRYYSRQPEVLDTMYYQVLKTLERMEQWENLREQMKTKAERALEIEKQNATIRLKPQPHWFFKYDTSGLFNNTGVPVPPTGI
ncbi:DUF4296 domain-containing protein [Flavihumibacter sp. R14]|nr:DUF4296 domain-containing protein [Flavihumibacter soli]